MTPRQPDAVSRTATDLFRERLDNMLTVTPTSPS